MLFINANLGISPASLQVEVILNILIIFNPSSQTFSIDIHLSIIHNSFINNSYHVVAAISVPFRLKREASMVVLAGCEVIMLTQQLVQ